MKAAPTHKTYSSFNVTPIWTQFQSRQNRKATNWSSNSRPTEVEPRCPPNLVGNVACSRRIPPVTRRSRKSASGSRSAFTNHSKGALSNHQPSAASLPFPPHPHQHQVAHNVRHHAP